MSNTATMSMYQASLLSLDDLMTPRPATTIEGLDRPRYERAYSELVEGSDPDVRDSFLPVSSLDDFSLYSSVIVNGQPVHYTIDEVERMGDAAVMAHKGPATIEGLDRPAYETGYGRWIETLDGDEVECFQPVEKLDDFSLYATVRINGISLEAAPSI